MIPKYEFKEGEFQEGEFAEPLIVTEQMQIDELKKRVDYLEKAMLGIFDAHGWRWIPNEEKLG